MKTLKEQIRDAKAAKENAETERPPVASVEALPPIGAPYPQPDETEASTGDTGGLQSENNPL